MSFAERLAAIAARIAAARARAGGHAVRLVAVSKKQPVAAITAAIAAGVRDFGENYAQELDTKRAALPSPELRWHAIGPIQRNKVKLVVGTHLIHTVDRPELLAAIEARAAALSLVQDVLVQVNLVAEASKSGLAPADLPALLDRFAATPHVRCRGLMLIPPIGDPAQTRTHFAALRELSVREAAHHRPNVELAELSMGMSDDFEIAIEEGATLVRVGTALFGARVA
ncbi:MAG TPA: YggS family pyridoxal phosphate-dependent enzyme [Nannocystaceae bacterium]|nr:YggS family pyridoxal phosphate-dependent enzyme [Nannocystaceae bacterium]